MSSEYKNYVMNSIRLKNDEIFIVHSFHEARIAFAIEM